MPSEALALVYAQFEDARLLNSMRRVCAVFKAAAEDEKLWQRLCQVYPSIVHTRDSLSGIRGRSANLSARAQSWRALFIQRYLLDKPRIRRGVGLPSQYLISVELMAPDSYSESSLLPGWMGVATNHDGVLFPDESERARVVKTGSSLVPGRCIYSAVHELHASVDETGQLDEPQLLLQLDFQPEDYRFENGNRWPNPNPNPKPNPNWQQVVLTRQSVLP